MDENAALSVISDLEDRLRKLREDNLNLSLIVANCQAFVEKIPKVTPDGDTEFETALKWLDWAKKELGYESNRFGSTGFSSPEDSPQD